MRIHTKLRGKEKERRIVMAVYTRECFGRPTSMYAIAKHLHYTPNGSFCNSVWNAVDKGLLDARPVSNGNRFAWQLTVTAKGRKMVEL